jgi:hypothetical protein
MPHSPIDEVEAMDLCENVAGAAWAVACGLSSQFRKLVRLEAALAGRPPQHMSEEEKAGESLCCPMGSSS